MEGAAPRPHHSLQPSCLLLLDSLSAEDDERLALEHFFSAALRRGITLETLHSSPLSLRPSPLPSCSGKDPVAVHG